jgi:hypothetical protein
MQAGATFPILSEQAPMLVRGDKLSESARREVLESHGHRWTVENEARARRWHWAATIDPPRIPLVTDAQWLREHAFHVVRDGSRLMANRRHAEPACLAD